MVLVAAAYILTDTVDVGLSRVGCLGVTKFRWLANARSFVP